MPGIVLMRRAAAAVVGALMERSAECGVSVLCGAGNNAGDGYLVAGLLHERGRTVQVLQVGDITKLAGDARAAFEWMLARGVTTQPVESGQPVSVAGDIVVDAMLGTGARGAPRAAFATAIAAVNNGVGKHVVAVDVPSGVDADTGAVLGEAIRADLTVTFIGRKLGLCTGPGKEHAGEVRFADLGVPPAVFESASSIPTLDATAFGPLPVRGENAHKGQFGHVLVVGGAAGMGGAAMLAAEAALRTGAGWVSAAVHPTNVSAVLSRRPEVMTIAANNRHDIGAALGRASVVAVGPGLGQTPWSEQLLDTVLQHGGATVIDADGLNLVAANHLKVPERCVLTPHPGEAARLLDRSSQAVQADRPGAAAEIARRYGGVVVLKGAGTLIAAVDGAGSLALSVCTAGNPWLATPGSGDVLTGLIAGFMAQGLTVRQSAEAGVFAHARAGDRLAVRRSGPLLASEIVDGLWPLDSS